MKKEDMNIVIVGHVDHGKSTLMGRLLADTDSLPQGKLDQVKEMCARNARPFEYAFLLDALKDEQAQGITIDTARCFFKTQKRDYIILDAPGHIEFLKNMITGASRAQAAILVIDAKEGVQENSRRHGYMLSMLGIKQVAVAINKMDLVNYDQEVFEKVKTEYLEFLKQINVEPKFVLPISAFCGDNIVGKSENMPWCDGDCILDILDEFETEKESINQIFRMPVQDVYKFTKNGDDRRIVAGTIETGTINVGDEVVFYPSGKKSHIKSVEGFNTATREDAFAGMATGFTLQEQIYIKRGEIMVKSSDDKPKVASRIRTNVFWLGKRSLEPGKSYLLKIGSEKVKMELEEVVRSMNSSDLQSVKKEQVDQNEVAECILRTERPIAFDTVDVLAGSSRFVIVDNYEITGGGIISEGLEDEDSTVRNQVMVRNYKWEPSQVDAEYRAECYGQKPRLIIFTGNDNVGKKELAKEFEKYLLERSRYAYYMGIGSFLYGVDSDIKTNSADKQQAEKEWKEHIRRFSEMANLMLDSGMILLATVRNLTKRDLATMNTVINGEIQIVWVGDCSESDVPIDVHIEKASNKENKDILKEMLKEQGVMFRA